MGRYETLKAVLDYFYQDNTQSGAHSRYNIKYHLVWTTKYRREVLTGDMSQRLKEVLEGVSDDFGWRIIAQEIMSDHVHILIETAPKYSPAKIAGILKSLSARKMREEFLGQICKQIWKSGTLWSRGYYVATVADGVTTDVVKEYIETQRIRDNVLPNA